MRAKQELNQSPKNEEGAERGYEDTVKELDAAKSRLEVQAQLIQAFEREKRHLDEKKRLEAQIQDLRAQLENVPRMVRIGGASYAGLRNIDEARLPELDKQLREFRDWVTEQRDVKELGNEARSRVIRILRGFNVDYEDRELEVKAGFCCDSLGGLMDRYPSPDGKMDACIDNRAFWCNQHQDCFLVVEALSTIKSLMLWRGVWLDNSTELRN
ncbi:MAG: hypothetical protein M1839_005002 [Geoglossum umbratile]|nr:MAG: hypothetical protein M1839_005002 [Geoglossum umbratile]